METNYDERTLHELENELQIEIVPGTEVMVDVGSHKFVKSGHNQQVLVPQPSSDLHDPLNWSPIWKFSVIACSTLFTFAQALGPLAIAPIFPQLSHDFHASEPDVVRFTGVTILVLGFSNFLWVPIGSTFGRRSVLLLSTLVSIGAYVWRAEATTYGSFMGASVLLGIGAGPGEVLQPTVITDVIFLHERGLYNTLYFVFFFAGVMMGPVINGSMSDAIGWRSFWWLNVALNTFIFFVALFVFPETKWHRAHPGEIKKSPSPIGTPKEGRTSEPSLPLYGLTLTTVTTGRATSIDIVEPNGIKGRPAPYQYHLFQSHPHPLRSLAYEFYIPLKILPYPIVQFASLVTTFSATCYLYINLTQSRALAAPPYNFSAQSVGFTNFASLVGVIIGLLTAGPLSDWVSAQLTRRNRGIREPEMRLLAMGPYVLIMVLGNVIVSLGMQHHWNWRIIVIIGFTCAGIQVAALPAIASTYAVDSYKPVSGAIFVSITVYKNVYGYGVAEFLPMWIPKAGFVPPYMMNMGLTVLWCACGVGFWVWGKKMRRWTARSAVHKL